MTFTDIFKKSFLEGYANIELSAKQIVVVIGFAVLLGLYIYAVYRFMTKKTFYSKSFNISLVLMSVITAAIILTVQSSVVISLGMVGALSIVRFRTAVKDPMDLAFLFWSISVGIICGAGLVEIALILSVVATVVIYVLDHIPVLKAPMILIVNSSQEADSAIIEEIKKNTGNYIEKSRILTNGTLELVYELRTKDVPALSKAISAVSGVSSVSVLSHDGEVSF
ncbi:MAG: DUF4956 domain-containing protein [Lachnospiraceae bacterium]|nr:DUF4956 domain-containing protein [Lachnospiraceae bacterium]MBR2530631.1 DUF4956 domain-containing protein [Lachnospiraceae bacterium]